MSGKIFFDTNVVVYAATNNDARAPLAQAFLAAGGSISAQVLNEFANTARRKLERSWPEVIDAVRTLRALCTECLPVTEQTHESATRIGTCQAVWYRRWARNSVRSRYCAVVGRLIYPHASR